MGPDDPSVDLAPQRESQEPPGPLVLRLYVAGEAANSLQARHNLRKLCAGLPPDAVRIEVIDSLQDPMRALSDGVLVTPTLVKVSPEPTCTIIGSLRDAETVARTLGLPEAL